MIRSILIGRTFLPRAISGRLKLFYSPNPQLYFSPRHLVPREPENLVVSAQGDDQPQPADTISEINDNQEALKQKNSKKTSILWKILRWSGILFVALMTFVALMPTIMMTPRGLGAMLYLFNTAALPSTAEIRVNKLKKFSWWKPVHAEGIQLISKNDGEIVGEVGELKGTGYLLDTIFGKPCELFISKPSIDLTLNQAGIPKLVHALQGETEMSKSSVQPQGRLAALTDQSQKSTQLAGEFKLANLNIIITDGILKLPYEINQAVGNQMYIAGALGDEQVSQHSKELDIDIDLEQWKSLKPNRAKHPVMLQANAQRFCFDLKGWSDGGRGIAPITPPMISVDYTPALAKYFLAQVNPLLDNMMALREKGQVLISFHPADGKEWISPGEQLRVKISPMHVALKGSELMEKLKRFVDSTMRPWEGRTLDMQTTTTSFIIQQDGKIITDRIDMLIGSQNQGIHVVLWGEYNLQTSQINMHLGLPQDTLAMIGLKKIPLSYVLPVRLHGNLNRPKLDISGASKEIAELTVRGVANSLYENDETFLGGQLLRFAESTLQQIRQVKKIKPEEVVSVPPLEQQLPWEMD